MRSGDGEGVCCGRIHVCATRRATTCPCRIVVREKDGLSTAECSVSFSCKSTKSASIPRVGVIDGYGAPFCTPPMASRALSVTASC